MKIWRILFGSDFIKCINKDVKELSFLDINNRTIQKDFPNFQFYTDYLFSRVMKNNYFLPRVKNNYFFCKNNYFNLQFYLLVAATI